MTKQETSYKHIFSKGIHLIVDRLTEVQKILTFFASDGRMFFAIPMGNKTCIGTTDTRTESPETSVSEADRLFVLDNINNLLSLKKQLTKDDIIAERCGIRPLAVSKNKTNHSSDWTKLSRKHIIESNIANKHLCIFGGKLTDCLNVGNAVVKQVAKMGSKIYRPKPKVVWRR